MAVIALQHFDNPFQCTVPPTSSSARRSGEGLEGGILPQSLRQLYFPSSPSSPVSDLRSPFLEFGKVRILYWYLCIAGGQTPCDIMTADESFTYDWRDGFSCRELARDFKNFGGVGSEALI